MTNQPAAPTSGNTYGHGLHQQYSNTFQASRDLDFRNLGMGEKEQPEKIRELNVHRLKRIEDQYAKAQVTIKSEREDEFRNIKQHPSLEKVDKKLSNMLASNTGHTRSYGLLSAGESLLKQDLYGGYLVQREQLDTIGSQYLDPSTQSPSVDETLPYSDGLSRTMLLQ